ncbi:NAD-dependent epimerase/dehydratase family protein [Jiella sp. M17.18]|uniref:NAD-dependent epimerase/dehydratase family protein n=1 Tax=Jiella sp. M17.18 TaxID=3234247 RepID=UPI0034DFF39D
MKRIIVTGGNGYVGRELVRLLYGDHQVCIVDHLRGGGLRFRPDETAKVSVARIDICDGDALGKLFEEFVPDTIVHLAAIHYIPECEEQPEAAVRTNVLGTVTLLSRAPEGCRIVFASSGAVYKPDRLPHAETSAQQPSDIYGLTKLHGEHYVANFARKRSLAAVVVRLFNVVGPGETNPHLFPELVAQLKAGRRTIQLGNLWPKRDYIHVRDAARGFMKTALGDGVAPGECVTVNLGTSAAYSVSEVVEKLRAVCDIDFEIQQDASRLRPVDRPFLAADTSRMRSRFGWQPELTVDDAMADLWRDPELTRALTERYL